MKNVLVSILAFAVISISCSKSDSKDSSSSAANESNGTEHCTKPEQCFLEVTEDGRSNFYASEANYNQLLTDQVVAQMNIDIQKVNESEYGSLVYSSKAPKVVYSAQDPSQVNVYQNANFIIPLIRIALGASKVFKNMINGLSIFSSIASIFSSDDDGNQNIKTKVNYHTGTDVEMEEIVVKVEKR